MQNGDILFCTRLKNNWVVWDKDGDLTILVRAEKLYYPEFQTCTDFWKVTPKFLAENFIPLD